MYYAIVTFGEVRGTWKSYYKNFDRAYNTAMDLTGPGTVRIVACETRQQAIDADIGDTNLQIIIHVRG